MDELFSSGRAPPCIVVFVDAWTRLGGSQYVDSTGTGRYHTYLCDDVVGWVDKRYRTLDDPRHRGISGKSSGGYGAMITPMLRPDLFGGLATHAGDALFEVSYLPDFPAAARALRDHWDGSYQAYVRDFRSRTAGTHPDDSLLVELWAVAACFSADADGTVRLPFDPATGRVDDAVWQRWLDRDPVRMAPVHADALRTLRAIWVDAGTSDEWYLDWPPRPSTSSCWRWKSTATTSSCSPAPTAASTTAIPRRCSTWPIASRHREPRRQAGSYAGVGSRLPEEPADAWMTGPRPPGSTGTTTASSPSTP